MLWWRDRPSRADLRALAAQQEARRIVAEGELERLRDRFDRLSDELREAEAERHPLITVTPIGSPITTTHPLLPVDQPRESPGHIDPATTTLSPLRCSTCGGVMPFGVVHVCSGGTVDYRPQRTDVA